MSQTKEGKKVTKKVSKKESSASELKEKKENAEVKKTENTKEKVAETKTPVKEEHKTKEVKTETKTAKKEIKVVKKKFILKEKKANKTKSKEAKENQKLLVDKKKLPTFRGRFGKKNIRKKSKAKWQKWRKPRSIDLDRGLQHGFRPKIGYRNRTEIRGIHPSGYKEVKVANTQDLEKVDIKIEAIRISATVGKRKRNEIVKKANEKGIWILN